MMRRIIIAVAALGVALGGAGLAFAAKGAHPHDHEWSWEGPFGTFDRGAVQRGFAVYKQVCSSCHGLEQLSYRNLGERGGPFVGYEYDGEITCGVHSEHHGRMVDPNDNPCVIAIADDYQVAFIDPDTGVESERPARPSDRFRSPYANEALALSIAMQLAIYILTTPLAFIIVWRDGSGMNALLRRLMHGEPRWSDL
jgi:ubiquinol-cytochrome c reductase cytochrome c1 subunit